MVRMNRTLGPRWRIKTLAGERLERWALKFIEDSKRRTPGRAVHASTGDFRAPATRFSSHVLLVEPRFAAERILAHILNIAFDVGFARGVPHNGCCA